MVCTPGGAAPSLVRRFRYSAAVAGLLFVTLPAALRAQDAFVRGVVSETALTAPLAGSVVELVDGTRVQAATQTDRLGRYLFRPVPPGTYVIRVVRLGYEDGLVSGVRVDDGGQVVNVRLVPLAFTLDPVVVTATMSDETKIDAPVSASVVRREDIAGSVVPTAIDHLEYVPGVDFARKGIATYAFSTRGPRNLTPESMLYLSDYRYAAVPYLRTNTSLLVPYMAEDVERIEVIRGPGAVLYGPNSRRGVVHVIRRSPLGPDASEISVAGGDREYFDAGVRISRSFADSTLGFKVSGRYVRGKEWPFADSVEVRLRQEAIDRGADPATLLLGMREDDIEGLYGEARFDWRPGDESLLATTVGLSRATGIETGGEAGAAQALDWTQGYVHSRFETGSLFAAASFNWGDAGDTYNLRNGIPLTNLSQLVTGQIQNEWRIGSTRLLAGTDVLLTIPRTEGTLNGRFEDDDSVVESGVYGYATTALSPRFDLIAALRVDRHNRLEDAWFLSPRAGVVFKPAPTHSVRFAVSRTFEQPTTRSIFADFSLGPLGPLPYNIQLFGLGGEGLTVIRDCGGLCMRTPDAFGGMGGTLLPAEATAMWPVIVGALAQQGVDISGLPAPTSADVATAFGALNFGTGGFDPVAEASIVSTEPIRRVIENVFEAGYKALLSDAVSLGADVYYTRADNVFASGSAVLTPNVFYDPATLTGYLANFMPQEDAAALAAGIATIPVGTVAVENSANSDLLVAPFGGQGGSYDYWGVDLMSEVRLTRAFTLDASYSFVSRDSASLGVGDAFLLFNIPQNKGTLGVEYRDHSRGLTFSVRGRAVEAFSVNTPAYAGRTDGYVVFDAGVGYELPFAAGTRVHLSVSNILNDRHQELVGSPSLGRWAVLRTSLSF